MKKIPNGKIKGFTLIEFLVASSLAIIVIMAAGSTYFFTRKLNDNAQVRIDRQNALRNAATAITRDARVAGSFGCFVTADVPINSTASAAASNHFPTFAAGGTYVKLARNQNSGYGVAVLDENNAKAMIGNDALAGAELTGNMLVFVYGKGNTGVGVADPTDDSLFSNMNEVTANASGVDADVLATLTAQGPAVLSSCSDAYSVIPKGVVNSGKIEFNSSINTSDKFTAEKIGELSLSRMYGAAYVLAQINDKTGLLRFETGADGAWREPQLLVNDVNAMDLSFAYANNCNLAASLPANGVQFAYADDLNQRNLPALIQIQLTHDADSLPYVINANVRGGNACSNVGMTQ